MLGLVLELVLVLVLDGFAPSGCFLEPECFGATSVLNSEYEHEDEDEYEIKTTNLVEVCDYEHTIEFIGIRPAHSKHWMV
jgi:hypothetical protein